MLHSMHVCKGRLVHTAASRARIRDLEADGVTGEDTEARRAERRREAVALAVRHVMQQSLFSRAQLHVVAVCVVLASAACGAPPRCHSVGVACKWATMVAVEYRSSAASGVRPAKRTIGPCKVGRLTLPCKNSHSHRPCHGGLLSFHPTSCGFRWDRFSKRGMIAIGAPGVAAAVGELV